MPTTVAAYAARTLLIALVTVALASGGAARAQDVAADVATATETLLPDGQPIFTETFDGTLDAWDASSVVAGISGGAVYFASQQQERLTLIEPIPMDNIAIEFRAFALTNGIRVSLTSAEGQRYQWALGVAGNQQSYIFEDYADEALAVVPGAVFAPGQWHDYRVLRRGATLEAYCDGRLVIATTLAPDNPGEGQLSFGTDAASLGLDEVRVFGLLQPDGIGPYQPLALQGSSCVKKAITCLGLDERQGLRGVQELFPTGTEKVALYIEIRGAKPNTEIELAWQRDGEIVGRQILLASGKHKSMSYLFAKDHPSLRDGYYAVDIEEAGTLVGRVVFTIGTP
jgi:hypothetical protein